MPIASRQCAVSHGHSHKYMYVIFHPNKFDVEMSFFPVNFLLIILFSKSPGFFTSSLDSTDENLCFHFSWVGITNRDGKIKCSSKEFKTIPCIEPAIETSEPPNLVDLWDKERSKYTCYLRPGYSCISYKYEFNGALVNSSYFCGKMLQDSKSAVETHCYSQKEGGHVVTACACRSNSYENQLPCNASRRNGNNQFQLFLLVVALLHSLN